MVALEIKECGRDARGNSLCPEIVIFVKGRRSRIWNPYFKVIADVIGCACVRDTALDACPIANEPSSSATDSAAMLNSKKNPASARLLSS